MNRPPPSFLTSVATTSMPTPRPAACVTCPAVLKPGSRMSCMASSSVSLACAVGEPERDGLFADQLDVDAAAIVGDHDHHFRAVALQADGDAADIRLAQRGAPLGRLDAVHHGIAQHVLERRHHALQHLPIEFRRRALHHQLGALAGVVGRLAHQPRQSLHVALERHHARAHQAVLQFGDDARLLRQQVLRLAGQRLQQALDAGDVARGLRPARARTAAGRNSGRVPADRNRRAADPRPDGGSAPALRSRFPSRAAAP